MPVSVVSQELASNSSDKVDSFQAKGLEGVKYQDPIVDKLLNQPSKMKNALEFNSVEESAKLQKLMRLREFYKRDFRATDDVVVVVDNANDENLNVILRYGKDRKINVVIREIVYGQTRIFKIIPPISLIPGKYVIEVESENGESFRQDFTWGVLAINTNKSIYVPEDEVRLTFGVLDEKGDMVCDADLVLELKKPDSTTHLLSTKTGEIKVNPECQIKDKVEKPDYFANYTVDGDGIYQLTLNANTKNGSYSISDEFEVRKNVAFDVERYAPTRIYPKKLYSSKVKIEANVDFSGVITDVVPNNFVITEVSGVSEIISEVVADDREDVLGASVVQLGMPFEGEYDQTLGFGEQLQDSMLKKTYEQFGLSGHDGIDFEMPIGTPILAVDEGTVTLAKDSDYGLTIVVQHKWGKSYYGHLSGIDSKLGARVTKGQKIGESGNTGLSTGSHLHFGVKLAGNDNKNGYYGKVNPAPFIGVDNEDDKSSYAVKFINWNVNLKKGESIDLSYTFDAPDRSPDFYTIGPLAFHESDEELGIDQIVFQEVRQWQIAVDSAGTDMILFWDPANGAAPTGWSVVNTYDGSFPRGESVANVLATGGNATHAPTQSGSVSMSAPSLVGNNGSSRTAASAGHAHGTPTVSIGTSSNLPAYRSMQLIQYDTGIPTTIPANAIAMFDASPGMPGSGWTRVTANDSRLVRVNSTVATGGSDTHTHTLTWSSLAASTGTVSNAGNTNNAGANNGHTHTAPAATNSDSQTSQPPFVATVLASANSSVSVPDGLLAMFDGDPGGQYYVHSESGGAYYQQFVRGDTQANAGTTGGTSTHSHGSSNSGVSGGPSSTARGSNTNGAVEARAGHTHTLSASFVADIDHTPQYFNVVIGEKVSIAVPTQIHSRWRNDDNDEVNATWRRSEDVSVTADNLVNRRLRIEVSNEGAIATGSLTYRLEYGAKVTACSDIVTWVAVPASATTEDFEIYNSSYLTDGNSTTDVAGGLTNENTTFVAGQVKDTSNQTSGITLSTTEFTEIEYSINVTSNPTSGEEFCFRVTNAGSTSNFSYITYPELTVGDPVIDLKHYRWREDDSTEAPVTGNTLYFNPTGNGFSQNFGINAGCSASSEWDCVDDGSADTSASPPTNDGATSSLQTTNGVDYYTLADDAILTGSTITRLDVYAYINDTGNPNTSVQLGYCTTCDGATNVLGSAQTINVGSYTQYTEAFTGLSLNTSDLNNMQLVVSANGTRASISMIYILVTYTTPGATWKELEDTAHTDQATGENIRIRVSIANTGDIPANRNYILEYASKAGASCGDDESFTSVPVTAGSEHFEMTTSTNFSDGDATTTQLTSTGLGAFEAGKMIEDPSNSTGVLVATNGQYSEFEYNFQANGSASGPYCFRITDNGALLDAYTVFPELSILVSGPSIDKMMRHGKWFNPSGVRQPFTF